MQITLAQLSGMSTEELRSLNRFVVAVLKDRNRIKQQQAAMTISVGGKYKFMSKDGEMITVRVDKVNQKTVNCTNVANGGRWRVSPSMLSPA